MSLYLIQFIYVQKINKKMLSINLKSSHLYFEKIDQNVNEI